MKRRRNWRQDRVYFFDGGGELVSVPAEWTDGVAEDPFVVVAAGRSPFHVSGLLELAALVATLSLERGSGGPAAVKQIAP